MVRNLLVKFTGFLFVGGISTLSSLVLIYFFIGLIKTPLYLTYAVIYIITIYLSYFVNAKFVFHVDRSLTKLLSYCGVYISGMLVGMVFIKIFKYFFFYEDWIISCLSLPFTTVWNFIFVSIVFSGRNFFLMESIVNDE